MGQRRLLSGTFNKSEQSECAIQAENIQDGKADAELGTEERWRTGVGMGEFEKGRVSREQFESKQLGQQQMHYVEPRW